MLKPRRSWDWIWLLVNHKAHSMAGFGKRFSISQQYETMNALLKNRNVDALVVSMPNYLHASQTIAALNAGIIVIVEWDNGTTSYIGPGF